MSLLETKANLEQIVNVESGYNKIAATHLLQEIIALEEGSNSKMKFKSRVLQIMNFYQGYPSSSNLINSCKDLLKHH